MLKERVLNLVYEVLTQLRAEGAPEPGAAGFSPQTVLFGQDSLIDSMGLVNLIVMTEEKIEETFGVPLSLADERAMSLETSPYRTVEAFASYIEQLLQETGIE